MQHASEVSFLTVSIIPGNEINVNPLQRCNIHLTEQNTFSFPFLTGTSVYLLDVTLGYGRNPSPSGEAGS